VLPHVLARTTIKGVPWAASLSQSVLGFAVILTWGFFNWEPQTHLFYWGGLSGGIAALVLITVSCVAVIAFFARHKLGESAWRRWIAPGLALVALTYACWQVYANLPELFGVQGRTGPAQALPLAVVAFGVVGAIWAVILKVWRPDIYRRIGTGARGAARPTIRPVVAGMPGVRR
jgi:amino acid transporter